MADWIASRDNPLTVRVMVNRIWQHHFGQGIVRTVDDFGARSDPPTHPELLDHLAFTFMDEGWSIKSLHRKILLSSTYGQSSMPEQDASSVDPDNRYLHRVPIQRLDAECIRDSILALSQRLDRNMFGPSIQPQDIANEYLDRPSSLLPTDHQHRRSIYLAVVRRMGDPFLATFDFPKPNTCVGQRTNALVPPQSLFLLNNTFVRQQAVNWGAAIASDPGSDEDRIGKMYEQAFARLPSTEEMSTALTFLEIQARRHRETAADTGAASMQAWGDFAHVLFNLPEFLLIR